MAVNKQFAASSAGSRVAGKRAWMPSDVARHNSRETALPRQRVFGRQLIAPTAAQGRVPFGIQVIVILQQSVDLCLQPLQVLGHK